jgi:choline dehydrogenase-like flavoprotein
VKLLVVGSGPSGVHFALTALRRNHQVVMIDVGRAKPKTVLPDADFAGLKDESNDSVGYFLGADYNAIALPEKHKSKEYYGLPPSKDYVFDIPKPFSFVQDGLEPLVSFAAGGLAECWTAGSYPLNDDELSSFPFRYNDIAPHYEDVAERIGVAGARDDLSAYIPVHNHLSPMLELDDSSARLLASYDRRREKSRTRHRAVLGRSRQAVLSHPLGERSACTYCGRCLWGCPNGAFYTPSLTLKQCLGYPNFTYVPDTFASHLQLGRDGSIEQVVTASLSGGATQTYSADAYILACGTLSTSNLVLRSIYKARKEIVRLGGLMDNRQVLAPFFNLSMFGRDYNPNSYQYHQLALGIEMESPERYVHGQITTLKTATTHPIFRNLPLDLKGAIGVFRSLRSGLGVLNLNFCDWRRDDNYLTLSPEASDREGWPALAIRYRPAGDEQATIKKGYSIARRFMARLGAPLVPGMTHIRPMGASVHYSGTLPMSIERKPWAVSPACQSYDISNLFIVDGAVMPFLPAKNLTFTLMANAVRVAATAF